MRKDCVFAETKKGRCSALKVFDCGGCSFFKTEEQYNAERALAEHLLVRKGLRPVIEFHDGCGVMTVERAEDGRGNAERGALPPAGVQQEPLRDGAGGI